MSYMSFVHGSLTETGNEGRRWCDCVPSVPLTRSIDAAEQRAEQLRDSLSPMNTALPSINDMSKDHCCPVKSRRESVG